MAEIPVDIVLFERHHGAPDTRPFPGVRHIRSSAHSDVPDARSSPELVALHILNVAISQNLSEEEEKICVSASGPLSVP